MRSCIVAIAKYEGDYIQEWVEYNLNLGFDQIIIGDNNDDYSENLKDILIDYIKNGKVTIIDIKDYNITQIQFYHHVYKNLVGSFDWVLFYDIDEFLVLNKHKTVNEYLEQEKFNDFDIIKINWKVMSNNGYVIQLNKPVLERFTTEGNNYVISHTKDNILIYANNTVKSFYRTNLDLIPAVHCVENPKYDNLFRYCDNTGKEIINKPNFPNWSLYNVLNKLNYKRVDFRISINRLPWYFKSNLKVPVLHLYSEKFYLLPDKLLIYRRWSVGAVNHKDITYEGYEREFVENLSVPKDSNVVRYQWLYTNKDGTRDKRYKNNIQFPLCNYGEIDITSTSGLNTSLVISNPELAITLNEKILSYQKILQDNNVNEI